MGMKKISRPLLVSISFPPQAAPAFIHSFKQRTGADPDDEFHRFGSVPFEGDLSGEALAHSWLAGRLLYVSAPRLLALEICCSAAGHFCAHEGKGTGFFKFLETKTYSLDEAMALAAEAEAAAKASRARLAEMVSWARSRSPQR